MTTEEMLKACIVKKYKNLNNFCAKSDLPYSTVANIFRRGLGGCSVSVVLKICLSLNIDIESLIRGKIVERAPDDMTDHEKHVIRAYRANPAMQEAVDRLLAIAPERE